MSPSMTIRSFLCIRHMHQYTNRRNPMRNSYRIHCNSDCNLEYMTFRIVIRICLHNSHILPHNFHLYILRQV